MDMKEFSRRNLKLCQAPNGFNMPLDTWTLAEWIIREKL